MWVCILLISCVVRTTAAEECYEALSVAKVEMPYSKSAVRTGETYISNLVALSHLAYLRARSVLWKALAC